MRYKGEVGEDNTLEDIYTEARICVVSCLVTIEQAVGSLDHVAQILKVNGYINAAPGPTQDPKVPDDASDLLLEMFRNAEQHARNAIEVQALLDNVMVEVEMTVLLKGPCEYPAV